MSKQDLVTKFAQRFTVDPVRVMPTLKATAFKVKGGEATDEQMIALMVVADQYGLNPFTKEIYAFPDKQNGIVPVVGIDGWSRIINENEQTDGIEYRQSESMKKMDDGCKEAPEWMECVIYRKDRAHPTVVREYLDEVYRPAFKTNGYVVAGPWQSHTKRMLRHKVTIQAARLAFGYVGIYDEDEAQRIIEGEAVRDQATQVIESRPALEFYPNDRFEENLPKWRELIASGKKDAETIIAMVSSKSILSDEQKAAISAPSREPGDDDEVEDYKEAFNGNS